MWIDGAERAAVIYDRAKLRQGDVIEGPAIITEMDSTTLVEHDCRAVVDAVRQHPHHAEMTRKPAIPLSRHPGAGRGPVRPRTARPLDPGLRREDEFEKSGAI